MILLLDNYDSFTFNLVHYLGELGGICEVQRNDSLTVAEALAAKPKAIILSPGPCDPERAGISVDLVRETPASTPVLGVCLGHQAIGVAYGGTVGRHDEIVHGKCSPIHHQGDGLFAGVPAPFKATRYHSLVIKDDSVPDCLAVTARTEDGAVMAVAHRERPVYGVQFHPESIATEHGKTLLRNFLAVVGS